MKRVILIFFGFLCMLSAQGQESSFQINGKVTGKAPKTVVLWFFRNDKTFVRQEIWLKSGGTFEFKGKLRDSIPIPAMLTFDTIEEGISFFLEPTSMAMLINSKSLNQAEIMGSNINEQYNAFISHCMKKPPKERRKHLIELVNNNPNSIFSPFIVQKILLKQIDYKTLKNVLNGFCCEATNTFCYHELKEHYNILKKKFEPEEEEEIDYFDF